MSTPSNRALSYQQVQLVPRYSELRSRADADLSVEFLGRRFKLCVIPANMQSVISPDIAHWLSESAYPYIYHRFDVPPTRYFVDRANRQNWRLISISVGVKDEDKRLLERIAAEKLRVDWICVDIAHGHCAAMREMIAFIRGLEFTSVRGEWVDDSPAIRDGIAAPGRGLTSIPLRYYPKIIAGNVATPEAVRDLTQWGAEAVKIGVGGGRACSTRNRTAFHVPMFTCVQQCASEGGTGMVKIPLILDGGIRENGDIAKALVAAGGVTSLVMAGSIFAACVDAPGESVYGDRKVTMHDTGFHESLGRITHKRYHGSASEKQKGESRHVEGVEINLPCNGLTYAEKYQEITESLSSSVSYAGGIGLNAFKHVDYIEVSP